MVFILGIDIPIIAFFSIVAITITVILLVALITMLWKGGKLIKEAGEVIDEEEKIHHIHLHPQKVSKPAAAKKGPSLFKGLNSFWESQKKEAEKSWLERHKEEVAEKKKLAAEDRKAEEAEIKLEKKEEKHVRKPRGPSFFEKWNKFWGNRKQEAEKTWQQRYNVETKKALQEPVVIQAKQPKQESWWEKHKKQTKAKEKIKEVKAPKPKKRPTFFQRWNNYWNRQKKDLKEGMKPEEDENKE